MDALLAYRPLVDVFLLHLGYAYAQYIVLRAGVFSIANAAFSAIGAYLAAIAAVRYGVPPLIGIVLAAIAGGGAGLLLSLPLARLRGVYQAIASLAFVQIVVSFNLYADDLTGGAGGFSGIPKYVGTGTLALAALATIYLMYAISATRLGRTFDAIREDEPMAASLGASVIAYQALAFAISGAIAGLFGALEAFHGYAVEPNQFGFNFVITMLSYVVLGGRRSIWGPVAGTAILVALPEIARPLADNRILIYGVLLMLVMNFMPRGIVDTLIERRAQARAKTLSGARETAS